MTNGLITGSEVVEAYLSILCSTFYSASDMPVIGILISAQVQLQICNEHIT